MISKKIYRLTINSLLLLGALASLALIVYCLVIKEWNTVAASLAVLAAIIATYNSQRISWKQEDEYEPDIRLFFDVKSRSRLTSLCIQNIGGSSAYDVKVNWDTPLLGIGNIEVNFSHLPVLLKGELYSTMVEGTVQYFEEVDAGKRPRSYTGTILYKLARNDNNYVKTPFEISIEHFRNSSVPLTDEQDYYLKSARISESLKKINTALELIGNNLRK